jgi:hypothetical protein
MSKAILFNLQAVVQVPLSHDLNAVESMTMNVFPGTLKFLVAKHKPPLWSSGQSSWLQIRRPGFDSRHYQKKEVVGLERGLLSLVSTTEELLDRKVAAPV